MDFTNLHSSANIKNPGVLIIAPTGSYIISQKDQDLRLNFDITPIFKNQITKSIVEVNDEQLSLWLHGYDLEIKSPRGITVIKHNDDLIGIGKSNGEKIFNYVPKERKLKTQVRR